MTETGNDERRENESLRELNELSLENPTRDYLLNNFTKVELQKRCRQLGLSKIWVTKEQLAEMILQSQHSNQSNRTQENRNVQPLDDNWNEFRSELRNIKENLDKKDNKIEELHILLKNAHVTINRLNDRITTLEEQIRHQQITPAITLQCEKTLLLGDDNLAEIRLSDLGDNCSVKTIKDTNMDLLKCWVNEKLELFPDKCIIYCGTNDVIENENVDSILDGLGSLTSELKILNENVELFVCELAPCLNEELNNKIDNFNENLKKWSDVNGIKMVKTNLSFKLGTGEVDDMCFNHENEKAST